MKEYITEIVIGTVGIATATTTWFLGGRQMSRNNQNETLVRGADSIVDSSNKLLNTLNNLVEQETARAEVEREHRINCETSLAQQRKLIDDLQLKIHNLELKISTL
jgi:hypothetical protein